MRSHPSAKVDEEVEKQAGNGRIVIVESSTKDGEIIAHEAHLKKGRELTDFKVAPDGKLIQQGRSVFALMRGELALPRLGCPGIQELTEGDRYTPNPSSGRHGAHGS